MMQATEQFSIGKCTTAASPQEDALVVTSSYAAVIDGATPKTAYSYPTGETPGQLAARLLTQAITQLPERISAIEAFSQLTARLHQPDVAPANRPIASAVIYSDTRREVWLVGDCQFAWMVPGQALHVETNRKFIDEYLAGWRRDIILSYLCRGLLTTEEIMANDPGRHIIQPHITQQVRYQNTLQSSPFAYGMLDGEPLPPQYIRVIPIPKEADELILASDGYPVLCPTLHESEQRLAQLLNEDPLCIGPLLGTKGLKPGYRSYDDRTYLRLKI